jgi:hypothetical protein
MTSRIATIIQVVVFQSRSPCGGHAVADSTGIAKLVVECWNQYSEAAIEPLGDFRHRKHRVTKRRRERQMTESSGSG